MKVQATNESEEKGECRALVALTFPSAEPARGYPLGDAAFLTQLAASKHGYSPYRAKRRAPPEVAAENYRTTIATALAYRPNGCKLNYCA